MRGVLLAATLIVGFAILLLVWTRSDGATPAAGASPTLDDLTAKPLEYRGLAIQVASGYQPLEQYGPRLEEIAALGANTVLLSVAGHMEHARSQSIYIEARKVPSPEDFKGLIGRARAFNLKTILMPIVLLKNPRGSEWRGVIEPPDWAKWWEEYQEFVLYFADIAREGGADALIVGSELVSAEEHTGRWVDLIGKARKRFWGGQLGYSANWDHYRPIKFWDRLDFVGMTSYYTLADHAQPTVAEIIEHWQPIRAEIQAWQRKIGKPILFTEVGWCSQEGAAQYPWNYYHNQKATAGGLEEQRRLYEAFVHVWSDAPGLLGVIWWEWTAGAGGPGDFGYTPRGKPAERVLRQWFKATSQPATAPATAPVTSGSTP